MSKTQKNIPDFTSINEQISQTIKSTANDSALKVVVDKRVAAEVEKRVAIIEKALDKYASTKKELADIKPDLSYHMPVIDESGKENALTTVKAYSDKALATKNKLAKLISELDIAFLKAFENDDYKKLVELVNQGGGQKNNQQGE